MQKITFRGWSMIVINREQCSGVENCAGKGLCILICEKDAIIEDNGFPLVINDKCDNCRLCISNCPNGAISEVDTDVG